MNTGQGRHLLELVAALLAGQAAVAVRQRGAGPAGPLDVGGKQVAVVVVRGPGLGLIGEGLGGDGAVEAGSLADCGVDVGVAAQG
ncbi:hypothetical protein EV643_1565 [Kribbella sp. VKM Ac-2527]|uniref:Uncharacterized protein n=1 Tax=Kribbella caucasensis TaxID=2512215 RepID=A0A4R6IYL9_9ACTN|nr:hypothetical protein EV643_1565 [Kribbella sp. VKM Ac-2527]